MSNRRDVYVVIQEDLDEDEALAGKAAQMTWYSVDHFDNPEEAEECVMEIDTFRENLTGYGLSRLDD